MATTRYPHASARSISSSAAVSDRISATCGPALPMTAAALAAGMPALQAAYAASAAAMATSRQSTRSRSMADAASKASTAACESPVRIAAKARRWANSSTLYRSCMVRPARITARLGLSAAV